MNVFLIFGGGHCKQVIDILEQCEDIMICGIFDDFKEKNSMFYGKKIIDTTENIHLYVNSNTDYLFCCIGDNDIRKNIYNKFINNYKFINCISKKCNISKSVVISGYNNYIGDSVNILADTNIGSNNIINTSSNIAHDCIINDHNHICPSTVLAGNVKINSLNLIGTNSTINPSIIIGNNNIIGSGCVVIKNINDYEKVVGVPGKKIN